MGLLTAQEIFIAGVRLRVHSKLPLVDVDDPFYAPFAAGPGEAPAPVSSVDVEVLADPVPPNESPEYFETGGEWMAQSEGDGYRLSLFGGGRGEYTMFARSDSGTTRVQVHTPRPDALGASTPVRVVNPLHYPLDQLLLMHHLAPRRGVIVHAAGALVGGCALIFPGVSGAGKSTFCRLMIAAGLKGALLSDDRVVVRVDAASGTGEARGAEAWGTPWPGDAKIARNVSGPLGAVLFLVQAEENRLVPVDSGTAMRRLMPAVSCPWYDGERGDEVLDTCARIVESFPCYELHFRPEAAAVRLVTGRSWESRHTREDTPDDVSQTHGPGLLTALVESSLAQGAEASFAVDGRSMMPLVRPGDVVRLRRCADGDVRAGDVVALRGRPEGGLLVHRVVRARHGRLSVRGDNTTAGNGDFSCEEILGVVSAVERDGREVWFGAGRWGPLMAPAVRSGAVNLANRLLGLKFRRAASRLRQRKGDDGNE